MVSVCEACGNEFEHEYRSNRARRFCSTACNGAASRGTPNDTCGYCGEVYFRRGGKKRDGPSKTYCSRKCKDMDFRGENHPLFNPRSPNGWGIRRRKRDACERCGWGRYFEVLVVHHRDHDRTNNSDENLETLCPTCHDSHHFETRTARFSRRP